MPTLTPIATLPPLRLVNRRTHEHTGPCPFCGGDQRSDRFHVWLEPGNARYWCRQCDAKGPLAALMGTDWKPPTLSPRRSRGRTAHADANPAHTAHYRGIYSAGRVTLCRVDARYVALRRRKLRAARQTLSCMSRKVACA